MIRFLFSSVNRAIVPLLLGASICHSLVSPCLTMYALMTLIRGIGESDCNKVRANRTGGCCSGDGRWRPFSFAACAGQQNDRKIQYYRNTNAGGDKGKEEGTQPQQEARQTRSATRTITAKLWAIARKLRWSFDDGRLTNSKVAERRLLRSE